MTIQNMHAHDSDAEAMKKKQQQQQQQRQQPDAAEQDHPSTPIELSEEAANLVRDIERERDEAIEARQRALADFQNFQRRAGENERRAQEEGTTRVVRSLLPVLDHFDLAVNQPRDQMSIDQLLGGVRMVHDELTRVLEAHGVSRIEPAPGEEFDPNRHEAMTRHHTDEMPPNHIVRILQVGYAYGDRVLRPAKVIIATDDA